MKSNRLPRSYQKGGDGYYRETDNSDEVIETRDRFPICRCPTPKDSGRVCFGRSVCRLCDHPI